MMPHIPRYFALSLAVTLFALPTARACLNDRDSDALALQAQRLPATVEVVTGRFARNPPLFYEMRIEKAEVELKKSPKNWGLYDDIAVAKDRLGESAEALDWMNRKRLILPTFDASQPEMKEAWYRYYANNGTFLAHDWIQDGSKIEDLNQLRESIDQIAQAIKIKPDAHFGRERYQLFALEWMLDTKLGKKVAFSEQLALKDKWEKSMGRGEQPRQKQASEGLSGLVVLGNAWQSPDIFEALARSLDTEKGNGLGYMALLRCEELWKSGKKPVAKAELSYLGNLKTFDSKLDVFGFNWKLKAANRKTVRDLYPELRREADQWQQQRTNFMLAQLRLGRHPDWDKKFWDGYQEVAAPDLDVEWSGPPDYTVQGIWRKAPVGIRAAILSVLASFLVLFWCGYRILERRRLR